MAEALASFVVETLQKQTVGFVGFLKTIVFGGKSYGPWTFIGKHYNYEPGQSMTEQHQGLRLIQKVINHSTGEDEEAARWSVNLSVSYGPVFLGFDSEAWKRAKQEAWQHVLRASASTDDDHGENVETITQRYVEEMRIIETESRSLYIDPDSSTNSNIASISSDDFIWIMILDGCFLLQIALCVLGGSKQLAYPADGPRFGQPGNKALIKAAISSMFIVGNQMPILVLHKLMQQSFFRKIVEQGKWQQPLDLERWVLFELLLVPMLDVKRGDTFIPTTSLPRLWYLKKFSFPSLFSPIRDILVKGFGDFIVEVSIELSSYLYFTLHVYFKKKKSNPAVVRTQDLFHGLMLLMSGLTFNSKEADDQIMSNGTENLIDDDSIDHFYDVIHPTVRSASELKEAGITFMNIEGTRIKGIRFEKTAFSTILKLPGIIIGPNSEIMFSNLIQYEVRHELDENRRKLCAYFQLMRELIRSTDDAKLLASSGIIVLDPNQEEELPYLLQRLPIPRATTGRSLGKVRDQLTTYTRPSTFKKLGDLLSFVALLTLIQTVYAIISYHVKN